MKLKIATAVVFILFMIIANVQSQITELHNGSVIETVGANNKGNFGVGTWNRDFYFSLAAPVFFLGCSIFGLFGATYFYEFKYPYDLCLANAWLIFYFYA